MASQVDEIEDMARGFVERFGTDALQQATLRIEELTANNQQEAVLLWQKIKKAIERMT
jgi:uncharacterized protein YheU (UPF0270 family)